MKVFGIGLARTGTTSLHRALLTLGLQSAPSSVDLLPLLDDPTAPSPHLDRYDAFTDNPVPFLFETLHQRCPDARFVLSTRPLDTWLQSMEWLFGPGLDRLPRDLRRVGDDVHRRVYGIETFDESVLTRIHTEHHERVGAHFADAPSELLTLPLDQFGWEPLCSFLGYDLPAVEFPRANAATPAESRLRRAARRLRD